MSPDDIALFRYHLIAEALSPHLTPAERGWLVRDLASRAHPHPDGGLRAYSRNTFDRWIRAYRSGAWMGCGRSSGPIPGRCAATRS